MQILGAGLRNQHATQLKFSPPLIADVDYIITVLDRAKMIVTLLDSRAWRSSAGDLFVTHINTRGDEAGWVTLPGEGVHVAEVVDGAMIDVKIVPSEMKVYQSALNQSIVISGSGFTNQMELVLEPPLKVNVDYVMEVSGTNKVTLTLRNDKKWRKDGGDLFVKAVKLKDVDYFWMESLEFVLP